MSSPIPALGIRTQPQSPAHVVKVPRRHMMAPWGVAVCVAAFVLCELALVVVA